MIRSRFYVPAILPAAATVVPIEPEAGPAYYVAYLAIGVENYVLSLKPAPVRWFLQMAGVETNAARGMEKLRLTAYARRSWRVCA